MFPMNSIYFSSIMTLPATCMLVACFLCILLLASIYFFRIRTVVRYRDKADSERRDIADSDYLPASVVVYSQGNADMLGELLKTLLDQNYPAAYEVIVVNDGESADVRDTVSMLRATHSNLYLTFTPEGVVNLSRKKLALTLGVKAARYDVAVLTTPAAEIRSEHWLRRIMGNFDKEGKTEVVLGFAYIDPDEDEAFGKRRRAFDYVVESCRWLGVAIAGKPFRGTEYNIAYRKAAFMRNKGFAQTLNLHSGDDDIFISEIARRNNTAVELSEESIVRLRHGNYPRFFMERVLRRFFTERFIRRRPRLLIVLTGLLQLAAIATSVAAGVLSAPNMQPAVIAAVLVLFMFALDIYVWRSAARALKSRMLFLTIPWLSVTYPFRHTLRHIRSRFGRLKKYTWD